MAEIRFACDAMLGGLARWLRFAGYDATFERTASAAALVGRARSEGRWLLTRDRALASTAGPRVVLLCGERTPDQVAELRSRLRIATAPERAFTRCSRCNGLLAPVAAESVRERVPPYVAAHAARFVACPGCGRIYWPGSHAGRIARRLEAWFGE